MEKELFEKIKEAVESGLFEHYTYYGNSKTEVSTITFDSIKATTNVMSVLEEFGIII